jgi:hypothetical protein
MMVQGQDEGTDVLMVQVDVSGEQLDLLISAVEAALNQAERALEYSLGRSRVVTSERVKKLAKLLEQLRSLKT